MIRYLNQDPELYVKAFYCSDISVKEYLDVGFGKKIEWDIPLLDGYDYEFLPAYGAKTSITFARPFNYGLMRFLKQGRFDALWLHGCSRLICMQVMVIAKICGIKVLIRDEVWEKSKKRSSVNHWLKKIWYRLLNKFAEAFLAIGRCNKEYYMANGIDEKNIFTVPYVVDNDFFQRRCDLADTEKLRKELGIACDQKVILYASKLSSRKKILDLISSFDILLKLCSSQIKPFLLIVGSGEQETQAGEMISNMGLSSLVHMAGFKNQTELPAYYKLCDVFVLPSENEAWGLVVNEAMNCGAAIVASDEVGAAYDLVKNGQNGYIFKTCDINDLAEKLYFALSNSRQFGVRSRAIIDAWSFDQVATGIKQATRKA
ncbi:MAG: glycosyltransferase family 4 protein [Candidatus Riflebacteria bacterium]|nr:glycosyltransferase family 4 protein [Candidatus Riflebacteria bacterium]